MAFSPQVHLVKSKIWAFLKQSKFGLFQLHAPGNPARFLKITCGSICQVSLPLNLEHLQFLEILYLSLIRPLGCKNEKIRQFIIRCLLIVLQRGHAVSLCSERQGAQWVKWFWSQKCWRRFWLHFRSSKFLTFQRWQFP